MEAVDSPPLDLYTAYSETIDRIEKAGSKSTAIKILSWLFHARRPIHMDEVREIVSVRIQDSDLVTDFLDRKDLLIQSCQGLVAFDERSGILRFTHYTVQEFLQEHYCQSLISTV